MRPTGQPQHNLGGIWGAPGELWEISGSISVHPVDVGCLGGSRFMKVCVAVQSLVFSQTNELYYMFLKVPSILTAFFAEEFCGPRNPLDGHTNTSRQSRPPEPLRLKTVQ